MFVGSARPGKGDFSIAQRLNNSLDLLEVTMARQTALGAYRIYTLNEDNDCLVAHNYAPTKHLAKRIARHLAAILNKPVYIYSSNSLLLRSDWRLVTRKVRVRVSKV